MGYIPTGFTSEEETLLLDRTGQLVDLNKEIIKRQQEEESRRKWTLLLGGIGAVFAAIKLGVIVIPTIRRKRAERLGQLELPLQ